MTDITQAVLLLLLTVHCAQQSGRTAADDAAVAQQALLRPDQRHTISDSEQLPRFHPIPSRSMLLLLLPPLPPLSLPVGCTNPRPF